MNNSRLVSWSLMAGSDTIDLLTDERSEVALHELTSCKFIVKAQGLPKPKMTLGDFEIPLKIHSENDGIYTFVSEDDLKCFRNFIGLTHADIYLTDPAVFYSSVALNIYARKMTFERALSFLRMIREKSDISALCFSVSKLNSDSDRSTRNITALLNAGIKALDYFQHNRSRFAQFPCSKRKSVSRIHRYSASTHLDDRSIAYMCNNPGTLQPSMVNDRDITVGSRNFKINDIETSSIVKDTDIIENQVIVAFIRNFAEYIKELKKRLNAQRHSASPHVFAGDNNYFSIDRLLKDSGLILSLHEDKIQLALDKCMQCMKFVEEKLPCKPIDGANIAPIPTQQVLARTHYLQLFGLIKNYYDIGEPQWRGQLEFFGLRNLYKIYEFVCLIFLIDSVKKMGFEIAQAKYIDNNYQLLDVRPINEPCNYYVFKNGAMSIELFYEPKAIKASSMQDSAELAPLVDLVHQNAQTWSPDFAMVFRHGEQHSTHVLDSKYSNLDTVVSTHLPECTFKYTTKMASIVPEKVAQPIDSFTILYSDIQAGYDSFYAPALGLYTDDGNINENMYRPIVGMMPLHEDNANEFPKFIKDLTQQHS